MSEVTYKVWRWNSESEEANKLDYRPVVEKFMQDVKLKGYTSLKPFYENVGFVDNEFGDSDEKFFRASVMYYKAIPNETDILKYMNADDIREFRINIIEHIGHQGAGETWHVDDDKNFFDSALLNLEINLQLYLNAGYAIMNNNLYTEENESDDTLEKTIVVELHRTAFAKKIIAEQKKQQEHARQNRVVKSALNVFEPNLNRTLEYGNLTTQKAGNRTRRNKRKNRKTRNKNFS
jgi:hypothetical protein